MSTTELTLSAAGATAWVPLDTRLNPFEVVVRQDLSSGASLTSKFQYTISPMNKPREIVSITRSTTTATLTFSSAHGLSAGSSLVIHGAGAPFDGTYDVTSVGSATVVTYTVTNSGATTAGAGTKVYTFLVSDWPSGALTTSADDFISGPVTMVRGVVTAYTGGSVRYSIIQSGG